MTPSPKPSAEIQPLMKRALAIYEIWLKQQSWFTVTFRKGHCHDIYHGLVHNILAEEICRLARATDN